MYAEQFGRSWLDKGGSTTWYDFSAFRLYPIGWDVPNVKILDWISL